MTSVLNNPKYLSRLWAALNGDFESLEKLFLRSSGWTFEDFAKCCRHLEITLIMHATLGRGKGLEAHYKKTTSLILMTTKSIWLNPYTPADPADNKLDLKRRIFGFFLTYLMYMKQPCKGRVKIVMGLQDLETALIWKEQIKSPKVTEEVEFIIQDLALREAFQFQLTAAWCGFDAETRNVMAAAKSGIIPLTREMKNIQDDLNFSGMIMQAQSVCVNYQSLKIDLAKRINEIGSDDGGESRTQQGKSGLQDVESLENSKTYGLVAKFYGGEEWLKCIEKLAAQADQPVMTIQNLTATEAIDRRMMMETRKRIERMRKKVMLSHKEGVPKTSRPYVNEGGIFGRKKEVLEGEQKEKRERGLCSGNLWTFINGYEFGSLPEEPLEQIIIEVLDNDEVLIDADTVDDIVV